VWTFGGFGLFVPYPRFCLGNLANRFPSNWHGSSFQPDFALKSGSNPAEITRMFFRITGLCFSVARRRAAIGRHPSAQANATPLPDAFMAWDGVATPGVIGRPGDLPVPPGEQLRRWGALLALAGLALPGVSAGRIARQQLREVAVTEAAQTDPASGPGAWGELPSGAAGDQWLGGHPPSPPGAPAAAAPWEAGAVEADGKPLPTAPPPGPVPVDGIPLPAVAAAPGSAGPGAPPTPRANPGAGETVRSVPNQSAAPPAGVADDLVPSDREYLRPILVRYAQENGLPADVVMALAWVESSWRRNAVSDAGAVGVMQLMPNTVEYVSKKLLGLRTNLDPRNPTSNVRMGTRYLKHLLAQNRGNMRQALIAYNQGLTSLRENGSYSIAERYADRVLALRPQFRSA
jgi:soluble lytic murein transglycosylase-like protein